MLFRVIRKNERVKKSKGLKVEEWKNGIDGIEGENGIEGVEGINGRMVQEKRRPLLVE